MAGDPIASTEHHFADLDDPRIDRTKLHKLLDIVVIAICAVICGADRVAIETFGKATHDWFKKFLELPAFHPTTPLGEYSANWTRTSFGLVSTTGSQR